MNAHAATITGSKVLDDVAEVIGEAATFELAWAFRGIRLYIPHNPASNPAIAKAIGDAAAARLCDAFWRTYLTFPLTAVLERRVHQLVDEGRMTKQAIALELGIAERRLYRILKRPIPGSVCQIDRSEDDRQLSLI